MNGGSKGEARHTLKIFRHQKFLLKIILINLQIFFYFISLILNSQPMRD